MPRKPKYEPEEPTLDEQMDDLYDQAMADIYDILMEAYDKIGVRTRELMESVQDMEVYEVELEDDELDDDDTEY